MIDKQFLAAKHKGMMISASGVLGRIRDKWKVEPHMRYGCGEMLRHLTEMVERFYGGDVKAVDEFLQLYCLDVNRPIFDDASNEPYGDEDIRKEEED